MAQIGKEIKEGEIIPLEQPNPTRTPEPEPVKEPAKPEREPVKV